MIKVTKDGRTIRTGKHYTDFRREIYRASGNMCENCGRTVRFEDMQLHHKNGRGMGGGKRNDVENEVQALCFNCHRYAHGN